MIFLFNWVIFRFHVHFQGVVSICLVLPSSTKFQIRSATDLGPNAFNLSICVQTLLVFLFDGGTTPLKINGWNLKNHQFAKENHLTQTSISGCKILIFQGVLLVNYGGLNTKDP